MASLLFVVTAVVITYLSKFVYNLIRNLVNARKTGIPFVVVPLDPNHTVWQLASIPLLPFLERCLPRCIKDRIALTVYGWEFREKLRPFEQYAKSQGNDESYMLVTCGGAELWTCDPGIVSQVLSRPNDFNQSYERVLFMSKFGHNVVSTNGERWARQRKIMASIINERISKVVFQESIRQTEGLLKELGRAWIPIDLYASRFEYVDKLNHAVKEFPVQTSKLLEGEQRRLKESGSRGSSNNVMSQLLQASAHSLDSGSSRKTASLSDKEMMGNLFFFTAAGFDTTANTISYALILLARFPQWQTWVLSEIDAILPSDPTEDLDYVSTFPGITRVLAFMLETLRLFSPFVHISKNSAEPQTIEISRGPFWIPANTTTFLNLVALHFNPAVWAGLNLSEGETASEDDAAAFRPGRWINPPGAAQPLFQSPKGTYIPWSGEPRVCPGQNMAQVEFVAIFLTLLRQHRIEAAEGEGETRADVDRRLDATMRDS